MLLVHPPVARSPSPPLGIARAAAAVRSSGGEARCLDLCREGLDWLLEGGAGGNAADPGTRLADARRGRSLAFLRSPAARGDFPRYSRAVADLELVLAAASAPSGCRVSLADYRDGVLSPVLRADLAASAARPEANVFHPHFSRRLEEVLGDGWAGADGVVGLSVGFLSQALCAFAIAGWLRRAAPGLRVVLGGGLVSSWASQGRLHPGETFGGLVDAVLPGRAEDSLPAFLGLAPSAGRSVVSGAVPPPFFDDFDLDAYHSPGRVLPFNFSWGCPWKKCSFCPERAEDAAYRGLQPEAALDQVDALAARHGTDLLHFADNELSPAYLRAFARRPPPAPWHGFARFTSDLADPGFCAALAASGCLMLQLGLESGSQEVLDALGKGTDLGLIDAALRSLSGAGIGVYVYVLFGTPAEDEAAARATMDFVSRRAPFIDYLNVAVFNMPLAGPDAAELGSRAFYEGDLSLYGEFEHPRGWDRKAVRAFLSRDFGRDPAIRAILARTPPAFTSSHAAFMLPRRDGSCGPS